MGPLAKVYCRVLGEQLLMSEVPLQRVRERPREESPLVGKPLSSCGYEALITLYEMCINLKYFWQ